MKDLKMYINGKFVESKSGKWIDVLNPSTEEVISRQPEGTVEEVDEALDAAKAAQKAWAKTPAIERAKYLNKMADGIRRRRDEFVDIIMREQGKTRTWASVEVDVTADYYMFRKSNYEYESVAINKTIHLDGATEATENVEEQNEITASEVRQYTDTRYHKVKSGETLYSIAKRRGVTVEQLCKLNRLTRDVKVRPGQILRYS